MVDDENLLRTDNSPNDWCNSSQTMLLNFRLKENGKTASICKEHDILTYVFGNLQSKPELVYSGAIQGEARGVTVLWGEGVTNLSEFADAVEQQHSGWDVEGEPEQVRWLAESCDTKGFFHVTASTGLVSETVYLFRRGGWEYAVVSTRGRPINVPEDELEEYESVYITVHSPSGQVYRLQ